VRVVSHLLDSWHVASFAGSLPTHVSEVHISPKEATDAIKVPNASRAIIETTKLRDYLLSPSHPVGRFKAPFFAALGYSQEQWPQLEADLRAQLILHDAQPVAASSYGQKYEIRAILIGPSGRSAEVVSIWIILAGEDAPRLVTAYPGGTP